MTEIDMTGLLLKLADYGVTGIKVTYEGGGDSGAIENVVYTTDPLGTNEDDAFGLISELDNWGSEPGHDLKHLDSGLSSIIEDFAASVILDKIEDWWNNEGGQGDLLIIIPSGKYRINNYINITTIEEYFHEGDLISKTIE